MNARHAEALLTVALCLAAPAYGAERRGSVAFHYGGTLTTSELAWCGRFDLLVSEGRARGCRLIAALVSSRKLPSSDRRLRSLTEHSCSISIAR
jgi:hypothetical protein